MDIPSKKFSFTNQDAISTKFYRLRDLYQTEHEMPGKMLELIDIL